MYRQWNRRAWGVNLNPGSGLVQELYPHVSVGEQDEPGMILAGGAMKYFIVVCH
jgi:hypothetical protein